MTDLPELAGRLAAVPLGALARYRHGKPMHPRGAMFDGVLQRHGGHWGVPWLDAAVRETVVIRLSRGVGLPAPCPDLLGLAVRLTSDAGPVDLLLSTTGRGQLTRLVPVVRRDAAATYCSIMAYRCAAGSIRLAAFTADDGRPSDPEPLARSVAREGLAFTLAAARGLGPWQPFGRLTLTAPVAPLDPDVRFDAVRHPPHGLVPDGPMARFRAPAYAAARAGRDHAPPS